MPQFEVVDRPNGSEIEDELLQAIIDTKDTTKSVKVDLEGQNFTNWQSNVRNRLKKHKLKLRAKYDKLSKSVRVWVEDAGD